MTQQEKFDEAVLKIIAASRSGVHREAILTNVNKITSAELTGSLRRLLVVGKVIKATYAGTTRYYLPGTSPTSKGARLQARKEREDGDEEKAEESIAGSRTFVAGSSRGVLKLGSAWAAPARPGASDFMAIRSKGL